MDIDAIVAEIIQAGRNVESVLDFSVHTEDLSSDEIHKIIDGVIDEIANEDFFLKGIRADPFEIRKINDSPLEGNAFFHRDIPIVSTMDNIDVGKIVFSFRETA